MSIVAKFECPECNQKHELMVNEVFELYSKEIHLCNKCGNQFAIEHKAELQTTTFSISNKPPKVNNAAIAAIEYAMCDDDGIVFLKLWSDGEFQSIRDEWKDVPNAVFIGADPLFKVSPNG